LLGGGSCKIKAQQHCHELNIEIHTVMKKTIFTEKFTKKLGKRIKKLSKIRKTVDHSAVFANIVSF